MLYNRFWFEKDRYGLTVGGGQINNPGRYLVLAPPINGETAESAAINAPYFTGNPVGPIQGLGFVDHIRLHAQAVHHIPLGV